MKGFVSDSPLSSANLQVSGSGGENTRSGLGARKTRIMEKK